MSELEVMTAKSPQFSSVESNQTRHQSDDVQIREATVGYVADLKTLKQLSSSSAAAKAKRAQNGVINRMVDDVFPDIKSRERALRIRRKKK